MSAALTEQKPAALNQPQAVRQVGLLKLTVLLWATAIAFGAAQSWAYRDVLMPDGVSYLEIGEAYLQGRWSEALNGLWPPFYSWELAVALALFRPSAYGEFPVVHLVNFLNYLAALAAFAFFIQQLSDSMQQRSMRLAGGGRQGLPPAVLLVLGYALFIWSSLCLIHLSVTTSDILVAAVLYALCGLMIRMRRLNTSWIRCVLFGGLLGLGYLVKTYFFVLSMVFFGVALPLVGNPRRGVPRLLAALVAFCLVSGPFIIALSKSKGRFTFGDSGTLNYATAVNGLPALHWQGEPPGSGIPSHPTRQISAVPLIYEYAEPIHSTYPPWYDPSYWREGTVAHLDLAKNLQNVAKTLKRYAFEEFRVEYCLGGFLLMLLFLGGRRRAAAMCCQYWYLLLPAVAAIGMFSLVTCEPRYLAGFLVVFMMALFAGVHLPRSPEVNRLAGAMAASVVFILLIFVAAASGAARLLGQSSYAADTDPPVERQVACKLKTMDCEEGDRIAIIGNGWRCAWARLSRVRIVAELADKEIDWFWSTDDAGREKALEIFKKTGAKLLIARNPHMAALRTPAHWVSMGGDYYAYRLSVPESCATPSGK